MSKPPPFLSLYLRERTRLLQLIRHIVADRNTAEDLAQDTFLRLCHQPLGEGGHSPLFRTTQNLAIDNLQARQVCDRHTQRQQSSDDSSSPDLETQTVARQELETLIQHLRKLPRRTRQVFLLSRVDGLPYATIARQLEVSISTVEKDMIRTLQHCQRGVAQ